MLAAHSPLWRKHKNLVKGFVANLLHFVRQLVEPNMLGFVLKSVERSAAYFASYPKVLGWAACRRRMVSIGCLSLSHTAIRTSKIFKINLLHRSRGRCLRHVLTSGAKERCVCAERH